MKANAPKILAADWIEKFKTDMRSTGADIAVLVTKTMPKDMECFRIKRWNLDLYFF